MNGKDREVWLAAALLTSIFVGIMIYGVFWEPAQVVEETDNVPPKLEGIVKIGVMASHNEVYPVYEFLADMAKRDINTHCTDVGLNCSFEFLPSNAKGTAANAFDLTQMYKGMGIDLVVGYGWSSQLCVADSFSEENGMVLLSPSSTSPVDHLTEDDNAFRLSPHDFKEAEPIASIIRSRGVTDVVVLKRSDAWGDGLSELFKERFEEKGGNPSRRIGYSAEFAGEAFKPHLKEANDVIEGIVDERGSDRVAFLVLSFAEISTILEKASEFPALMDVKWFVTWGHLVSKFDPNMMTDVAAEVGLVRWCPIAPDNSQHERVNEAFSSEFGRDVDYYEANIYDALWIMALSAMEAGAADGPAVREVLPAVAANYTGVTGGCSLDANGDREAVDYALWVYLDIDGARESFRCGTYHHDSDSVEWDEVLMGKAEEPG
jgi:branched-chain amino acid transport system substrate-binding protein